MEHAEEWLQERTAEDEIIANLHESGASSYCDPDFEPESVLYRCVCLARIPVKPGRQPWLVAWLVAGLSSCLQPAASCPRDNP